MKPESNDLKPGRPPKPRRPRSNPSTPEVTPRQAHEALYSTPQVNRSHRNANGDVFDEEIYGQRPVGVPKMAVSVLPIVPVIPPRRSPPQTHVTSPLAHNAFSPNATAAANGVRQSNGQNLKNSNGGLKVPASHQGPAQKGGKKNVPKRSPSNVGRHMGAKKQSHSALTTYCSPSGYKLHNIKVRQQSADSHPAFRRLQDQKRKGPTLLELAQTATSASTESL